MSEQLADFLRRSGIVCEDVLRAIAAVDRRMFVEKSLLTMAEADQALPIGYGQTISQPYVVARMSELLVEGLRLKNVLEIGTGSGYQAAILAELVGDVYSIELVRPLYIEAKVRLSELGCDNVRLRCGDGAAGWNDAAPFDGVIITAATAEAPAQLLEQLAVGGRMVLPLGDPNSGQRLCVIDKAKDGSLNYSYYEHVLFVPLVRG